MGEGFGLRGNQFGSVRSGNDQRLGWNLLKRCRMVMGVLDRVRTYGDWAGQIWRQIWATEMAFGPILTKTKQTPYFVSLFSLILILQN